jgi:hypothetical protein
MDRSKIVDVSVSPLHAVDGACELSCGSMSGKMSDILQRINAS